MKTLSIILIALAINLNQQTIDFPIDDYGKYTFTDVVELQGMNKDVLYENGYAFMKKIKVLKSKKKHLQEDKENYSIQNKGSFYVYRFGSVKKAIDGAVEYDITLEFKDNKYRYSITNFRYNEYQKNRYGKYEPLKGKYIPLEIEASSLNKKTWEKYKEVVYDKTQELIINLSSEMYYQETKKNKKVKKDDNW